MPPDQTSVADADLGVHRSTVGTEVYLKDRFDILGRGSVLQQGDNGFALAGTQQWD